MALALALQKGAQDSSSNVAMVATHMFHTTMVGESQDLVVGILSKCSKGGEYVCFS